MATQNSTQYAKQVAVPVTFLDPTEDRGRIRLAYFEFGALTIVTADVINLIRIPAGKVRILRVACKHAAWTASATMSVGHAGYTDSATKDAVAASAAAFLAATAMDNTTDIDKLADIAYDTTTGFIVTATDAAAGKANTVATAGWLEYVQD